MRGNAHVRFGGRPGETDRPKRRHRAPGPPNHVKVRDRSRVVSKALVIAYAVSADGVREVIGLDLGEVESEAFWLEFLRSLRARGLDGVQLVISDYHEGLKTAITRDAVSALAALHRALRSVKGCGASTAPAGRVSLRCGRGRPPSEAQDLGLMPAAQLLPRLRALRVAPRWRRPRPPSREGLGPASRRPSARRRARPARRAGVRGAGPL